MLGGLILISGLARPAEAAYRFSNFRGRPPLHIYKQTGSVPRGLTPNQIKAVYHLPTDGGHGTIAIIGAYDDSTIEKDLNDFSKQFALPTCTTTSHCFEKHKMKTVMSTNSGWALETSLDVEWAHAIAPQAKILLVEAATPSGTNLLKAVDYAAARTDVVSISMSWGGVEFADETTLDQHFVSKVGAVFFASSGDQGTGVSWPAASPNVVSVGGTSFAIKTDGSLSTETAWSGSGGGVSLYEHAPTYQSEYSIPKSKGMRAIPDVAYDADPRSGFPIIRHGVWQTVGGTSAGAPQWAAITALGSGANNATFYADKASVHPSTYFHDIVSGRNGDCAYYCDARRRYDYVTGLGSPATINF